MEKKTLADYEQDIVSLHNQLLYLLPSDQNFKSKQGELSRRLTAWVDRMDIVVQVASNEQAPWTQEELGYATVPMPTRKASNSLQVGDYHAYLNDYDMYIGICVERKGTTRKNGILTMCDLYSTISTEASQDRFYNEINRYKCDMRFERMEIISECSHGEFMTFKPRFNGSNYNKTNPGMNQPARLAVLTKIQNMGVTVMFCGTRKYATEYYRSLIRQWCRLNYAKIIGI